MIIIIQARTGSSRLPNKMIIPFHSNKYILDLIIERIKKTFKNNIPTVIATSNKEQDLPIVEIAKKNKVSYYQGSESDVLLRFINAMENNNADSCIRICADNPFLSMKYLEQLIDFTKHNDCDYGSFITSNKIPSIKTHYVLWTEYVTLEALRRINKETDENLYHEHVTNYLYSNPKKFNCKFIPIDSYIEENPFRLTVDTKEDFDTAKTVYNSLVDNNLEIEPSNIISLLNNEMLQKMNEQIRKNEK